MALGRYSRIDNGRPSSSYCSTVSIVVLVALCLVGVWMLTSLTIVPVQNVDVPQEKTDEVMEQQPEKSNEEVVNNEVTEQTMDSKENSDKKQFEDNPGDLPDDAIKRDDNDQISQDSQENKQVENSELQTQQPEKSNEEVTNNEVTGQATDNSENGDKKQSEDNPGDMPDETIKRDSTDQSSQDSLEKKQEENSDLQTQQMESSEEVAGIRDGEDKMGGGESKGEGDESESIGQGDSGEGSSEKKSDSDDTEKKSDLDNNEKKPDSDDSEKKSDDDEKKFDSDVNEKKPDSEESEKNMEQNESKTEQNVSQADGNESSGDTDEKKDMTPSKDQNPMETFPSGAQSELLNETTTTTTGAFSTQAAESKNEKASQESSNQETGISWKLCNATAGPDFIPCLDNMQAIRNLRSTKHYEHRERHCPEDPPTCLVPLPEGYKRPIIWPNSREKIWYSNVPHTKLAQVKGHQNWVKVTGEFLTFPGGGTQFKHGALHYIDFIQESVPDIAWGKQTRVILDVGCGVASFGGYLFDRGVLTMSFAPKDEHEAQVQFALERGIPAISAVMGTTRLPFPARVFDAVHCARCRVPWHIEGGKLLLELNRVLRPGGLFVWSATPVYRKLPEDVEIWSAMSELTKAMCWELISINKDAVNGVSVATYRKPKTNECYEKRAKPEPPLCADSDDPNAAWNVPLQECMHKVPTASEVRGSQWPEQWPSRLEKSPYWLLSSQVGVYGKPASEDFAADYEHWKRVVSTSYMNGIGIDWSNVRNVMDMRSVYGGFAAALKDLSIWVMNVVSVDAPDTLPIIYERGLFGMYHDWCQSFSTYPRTYDLLHADHLFSNVKQRCKLASIVAEVDRILRPEGKLIVRDDVETIGQLESLLKSMHWEVRMTYSKDNSGLLCIQKTMWRPTEFETLAYAAR